MDHWIDVGYSRRGSRINSQRYFRLRWNLHRQSPHSIGEVGVIDCHRSTRHSLEKAIVNWISLFTMTTTTLEEDGGWLGSDSSWSRIAAARKRRLILSL